jgi:hypothetical protein
VLSVLEQPELPPPGTACTFCRYRETARETGY